MACLVIVGVIVQVSLIPAWRPLGAVPNLVLVILVLAASWRPATQVLILAVGSGLWLDFVSGSNFGLRLSFLTLMVLVVAALARLGTDFERLDTQLMAVAAATVAFNLAVLSTISSSLSGHWGSAAGTAALELGQNLIMTVVLSWLLAGWLTETPAVIISSRNRAGGKV